MKYLEVFAIYIYRRSFPLLSFSWDKMSKLMCLKQFLKLCSDLVKNRLYLNSNSIISISQISFFPDRNEIIWSTN